MQFPETADESEWVRCLCGAPGCSGYMNRGDDVACGLYQLPSAEAQAAPADTAQAQVDDTGDVQTAGVG